MLVVTGSCSADSGFRGQISLSEHPPPVPAPASRSTPPAPPILARRDAVDAHTHGPWDPGLDLASAHRTHSAMQPAASAASLSLSVLSHTHTHNAQGLFLPSLLAQSSQTLLLTAKFLPTSPAAVTQDLAR